MPSVLAPLEAAAGNSKDVVSSWGMEAPGIDETGAGIPGNVTVVFVKSEAVVVGRFEGRGPQHERTTPVEVRLQGELARSRSFREPVDPVMPKVTWIAGLGEEK